MVKPIRFWKHSVISLNFDLQSNYLLCWHGTQSKNSNTKLTLGFLYEMVFVWNDSSARVCKNSGTTSYKKSLFEVTPMLLYEMVCLVQSGLCSKWSLYEVTVNLSAPCTVTLNVLTVTDKSQTMYISNLAS